MLSIIIPAYNAQKTLPACLDALKAQICSPADAEIIVVDNNSKDDTARIASEAGVVVVNCLKQGAGAARNAGIAQAKGDIICFTDADCLPTSNWLKEVSAPLLEHPELTACKGSYLTTQPELIARFVQIEYEDKYDLMRKHERIDFIDTYSAAFRKQDLLREGGFDERMTWLEDQELSFRLARLGCQMTFQESAVVYHKHEDSLRGYLRKKSVIGYWKAQVIRLHPERLKKDTHTPQVMKIQMLLAMMLPVWLTVGIVSPGLFAILFLITLLAFAVTTLPFVIKAWPKDKIVALISPLLLLLRAAALSIGYLRGLIRPQKFVAL